MTLRLTSRGKRNYEKGNPSSLFKRLLILRLLKNCKEGWSF